jgi:hypothetical protein
MPQAITLIICVAVMFLCVKSIKNDLTIGPSELEMLRLENAYLEGVKVGRSGEDHEARWQELEKEFSK